MRRSPSLLALALLALGTPMATAATRDQAPRPSAAYLRHARTAQNPFISRNFVSRNIFHTHQLAPLAPNASTAAPAPSFTTRLLQSFNALFASPTP